MERKLKPILVNQVLREKGIRLFSPDEFRHVFRTTLRGTQEFIKDHTDDLFLKLRNGLYALRSELPSELEIANRLYQPSYVSFEYALAYFGIVPETVYTVTSATPRLTREFTVQGKTYEYSRIKKTAYCGYRLVQMMEVPVLMASPEKALVDYLYFVDLKLKVLNERLRVKKLDPKEITAHARRFRRPGLMRLVKEII